MKKTIINTIFIFSTLSFADSNYYSVVNADFNEGVVNPTPIEFIYLPAMNSYSNEFGSTISSSEYNFSNDYYPNWKGFDQINVLHSDSWLSHHNVNTNEWIGFSFNEPKNVNQVKYNRTNTYPYGSAKDIVIEYSDDLVSWHSASSNLSLSIQDTNDQFIKVTEKGKHRHWRMFVKNNHIDTTGYTLKPGEYANDHAYFIAVGDINFEFNK